MQQTNTEIQTPAVPFISEPDENGFENESVKALRWTRDEYYQMAEMGFFDGKRVELIEGEIIEMAPMKSLHTTGINLTCEILREIFTNGFTVRVQGLLSFDDNTEPEPDVAVVKGKIRDYSRAHPKNRRAGSRSFRRDSPI